MGHGVCRRVDMTSRWVKGVEAEARPCEWTDVRCRGLILRVETSGKKCWCARQTIRGRYVRIKLGRADVLTLAAARKLCRTKLGALWADDGRQHALEQLRDQVQALEARGEVAAAVRPRSRRPTTVYAIQASGGPIKIGITWNVQVRLKELQTAHPGRLTVVGTSDRPETARQVERRIHQRLRTERIGGEWFHPTRRTLLVLESYGIVAATSLLQVAE